MIDQRQSKIEFLKSQIARINTEIAKLESELETPTPFTSVKPVETVTPVSVKPKTFADILKKRQAHKQKK